MLGPPATRRDLPQHIKDQIPSIEDDVDDHVLILSLCALEKDSFEYRTTQNTVDANR